MNAKLITPQDQTERKPYASPALVQHGSVEQLTQTTDPFGAVPGGPAPSSDADDTHK